MNDVEHIQKGMQHRPFNKASEAHQRFLKQLENRKDKLNHTFPHIFILERSYFGFKTT